MVATIRSDPEFNNLIRELALKYNLSTRAVTVLLTRRMKGLSVVEVKDKSGGSKKLTFKRLSNVRVEEIFDEFNF